MRSYFAGAHSRPALLLLLIMTISLFAAPDTRAQSEVMYRLVFTSTWSASTHPTEFPSNPHYSSLRGSTHNSSVSFFSDGVLASAGIKLMAETGSNSTLDSEIAAAMTAGTALNNINGGFLNPSPGSLETTFTVTTGHPRVSVVAMLAPSPDWFIGLDGVELYTSGTWVTDTTVVLYAYDAGTDSGASYASPNAPTTPPVPIFVIGVEPFLVNAVVEPVGTIQLLLETPLAIATPTSASPNPFIQGPYPNPATNRGSVDISLDRPKSVTISVFDILGREVLRIHDGTLPGGTSVVPMDVTTLTPGVYVLQARTPQESRSHSFSVVR